MDLRANTAVDVLIGPFVDITDGNTTEDGLTLLRAEIKLSKNGQALTQKTDTTSAAFDDDGYYNCELDATDTDTEGNLVLIVHQSANALPVRHEYDVLSEAAWDSLYIAKDTGFMRIESPDLLQRTTIATLATQTSFTLAAGSADNDTYIGATIVIRDASTEIQKAVGVGLTYVGSSKTLALRDDPGIFTMAVGDTVEIIANPALKSSIQNRTLGVASTGDIQNCENVDALGGDTTAADNIALQYNGTGLTGDTFPATQAQLGQIALTGAAVSTPAKDSPNGFNITWGENEANDEDSTHSLDDVTHDIEAQNDTTEKIDVYYEFAIGGDGVTTGVQIHHQLDRGGGVKKNITILAFNWGTSTWDQIGSLDSGTSLSTSSLALFTSHVGTGANVGLVRIRYNTGTVAFSTTTKLLVDQIFVEYAIVNRSVGYANGEVWLDTNLSNTNTESFVDGTADNPVSSWAAVLTLLTNLGLHRVHVISGSTVTLSANSNNLFLTGVGWILNLNSQSIVHIYVQGASVSGIAAGIGTTQIFENCIMGAVSLIKGTHLIVSSLANTITVVEAGDYFMDRCHSGIAGTATPTFDFGSVGNTNLNMRNYSGGIQLEAMGDTGTDTASIEGRGQIIEGTCTGGIVAVRGLFTLSGITNLTLVDDARYDITQINNQVLDVINVDTFSLPGQEAPPLAPTIVQMLSWPYKWLRNKTKQSNTQHSLMDDAGTTVDAKVTVSDVSSIATKGEVESGP